MTTKYVYAFAEGRADMHQLLGGKGANLAEMTGLGLPVPPGFTITTEACGQFQHLGRKIPDTAMDQVRQHLTLLESTAGRTFGGNPPLLLSVRSGSPVSMPGMMDTILNLGLTDDTVVYLATATGDARFAWDCYRRFIQMFANVVLHVPMTRFDQLFTAHKTAAGVKADHELPAALLKQVVAEFQRLVRAESGTEFPQSPLEQLQLAIAAVFASWNNPRAIIYRKLNKIPDELGTAVNIQAMVFGNMGNTSGTGVIFTRNPNTGEQAFYGEYLLNAQGEDVVAGIRTPQPISVLRDDLPAVYEQLYQVCQRLEHHYLDMQDIEFTVENGTLYMLQCRSGKRTAQAAVQITVDMAEAGVITRAEALMRVDPAQIEQMLVRSIDPRATLDVLATGLPASPGAATGICCFDADQAERLVAAGHKVILVRPETSPEDIHGMLAAQGIVTSRGGMTSHAAIVARGMGKPAVVGCEEIRINMEAGSFDAGGRTLREGALISIDGATGNVMVGQVPLVEPSLSPAFRQLLTWADETRALGVWANADNPDDAQKARDFGADGIGLVRTEHMFGQGGYHPERLPVVRAMVLADTLESRQAALGQLLPMQREDFYGILRTMAPLPVVIRLLDPPLHEFLPSTEELVVELALMESRDPARLEKEQLLRKVRALSEVNPMLGFRGCRLGMIYPEIYEMQVQAIFEAACQLQQEGTAVKPEIMIPLVGHANEMSRMRLLTDRIARQVFDKFGTTVEYAVGACIEVPRACLIADAIARDATFFSYGTNDLTQTTFGYSRDDAEGKFLAGYVATKVLPANPFVVLDEPGVGELIKLGTQAGRRVNPNLKVGICGEHGGEPASILLCHRMGLTYVSCSPYRVPIARLAAAQAALRDQLALDPAAD